MKFSEKLKSIRTRLELSQDDLASIINVSRQAITKWETGVGLPDIENLKVLSKLFNLPIDTLLDDDIKCLCVQYGYSYGDLYRFNGKDCLTPREETKSFRKMVLEYKLGGNDYERDEKLNYE